jgi:hypothetical protein
MGYWQCVGKRQQLTAHLNLGAGQTPSERATAAQTRVSCEEQGQVPRYEALALVEVSCGQRCGLWVHSLGARKGYFPA